MSEAAKGRDELAWTIGYMNGMSQTKDFPTSPDKMWPNKTDGGMGIDVMLANAKSRMGSAAADARLKALGKERVIRREEN